MPTKDDLVKLVQAMPDDATVADLMERLYLLDKIERGIAQADAGQKVSQDEACSSHAMHRAMPRSWQPACSTPPSIWRSFRGWGRMVPEMGRDDIREVIVGSYRVIYRLQVDEVEILAVHHGARRLEGLPDA